jgi:DNA (cytosine-5)-methyltransferase 1
VQTELEAEGYEVLPFLLPACAVNAPHRRDRIWFIAYSRKLRLEQCEKSRKMEGGQRQISENGNKSTLQFKTDGNTKNVTDTTSIGLERECRAIGELEGRYRFSSPGTRNMRSSSWENFPTEPPICRGDDGLPKELDNITFSKWRNESIKAYGNAIVPQVAYQIFKSICQYQEL